MIKKLLFVVGIPILIMIIIIVYFTILPWILIAIGSYLLPNPPKPEITYAEFPLRLVYEINGNQKVIEDILVCEFDGYSINTGSGKSRKWKSYLVSGNEHFTLLELDISKDLNSIDFINDYEDVMSVIIYYPIGSARYYMGDLEEYEKNYKSKSLSNAAYLIKYKGGSSRGSTIEAEELLEKHNIRLISWEKVDPIENKFINIFGRSVEGD